MIETALSYAKLGWSVIPIRPPEDPHPDGGEKVPYVKWKPLQKKPATEKQLRKWFKQFPKAQVGVVTGKLSNLVVIDVDSANALEQLRVLYDLPETIVQFTGRAGYGGQYLFTYPKNTEIKNDVEILKSVDVRGEGGIIVLPPSKHKSGKHYKWGKINPIEDGLDDLLDLTPELIKLCQGQKPTVVKPRSTNKPGWVDEALMGVNQGQRNQTCTKLAGYYLRVLQGDIEGTFVILKDWNQRFNKPPLDNKEIRKIVESIGNRPGLNELADLMETEIYQMEILKYPDNSISFRIYINGLDKYVVLSSDDISSPRSFRTKVLALTYQLMPLLKDKDWRTLINKTLREATKIQMNEDETNLAVIRRIILSDIKRGEYEEPEKFIENSAVIYKEDIHLYLDVVIQQMKFKGININRKELGILLRLMDFATKSTRLHKKMCRTWQINKDEFIKHSE